MCGIIACLEKNPQKKCVISTLLGGLKQLQNRGYDSAGIVLIDKKSHKIIIIFLSICTRFRH